MKYLVPKKRSQKRGLPPGSLIHIGEKKIDTTRISVTSFSESKYEVKRVLTCDEDFLIANNDEVKWVDVEGLSDVGFVEALGDKFGLHQLVMEDILNTDQRPKMEDYCDYIFIVLKMLCLGKDKKEIVADQVSIIIGNNYIITFQEGEQDVYDPIRERLKSVSSKLRKLGSDYLAYAIIDAIVDNYFLVFERIGDDLEILEDELVASASAEILKNLHVVRRDMVFLRKSVWPLRELVGGLERIESDIVKDTTRIYLRDVHDHAVYLVDTVETFREMLQGMLDVYLTSVNNRMNEVMKVLTIIATLFMPLTFIAGVYGMNFRFMPELEWRFGYPMIVLFMVGVAGCMFTYFRKKKWL